MSQVSGEGAPQAPQVSEEEKERAMNNIMMGLNLSELGIIEIELMLTGCITPPEASTFETWHRWAREALDHNDMDKAVQIVNKMVEFLEKRQKLCEELERKRRRYYRNSSRRSARH
jgi:hypothetical protein